MRETPSQPTLDCDPLIERREQAVEMLSRPACLDKAISALDSFSTTSANAMSDLGAAYYLRATRRKQPEDLLLAFDATQHAKNAKPQPPEALFNSKLIENALGLGDFSHQWSPDRLHAALQRADSNEVSRIVRMYPTSALRYMQDELLPSQMKEARLLASVIAQVTGDRYAIDEVNAATPALKDAYAAFRLAHLNIDTFRNLQTASDAFHRANSPAALYTDAANVDVASLDPFEQEARRRNYRHLTAFILSMRGYWLLFDSRYLEALSNYEAALAIFQQLHDPEAVAATRTRIVGILRVTGQYREAWQMALALCLDIKQLPFIKERNLLLGETAATASELKHPLVAARYAEAAFALVRRELAATPPEQLEVISFLQHQLSVALRRRASYELENGEYPAAERDLNESARLTDVDRDASFRIALKARAAEVRAQALASADPPRAAAQYRIALNLSEGLEYRSFRASLYAQLAAVEKDQPQAAEQDLRNALAELNAEESTLLTNRKQDDYEKLVWSNYFSRFQATYHTLITLLIDTGRAREGFTYADRARAFEPLNLALKLAPTNTSTVNLEQVQQRLPRGTFLIEYTLLDDRAYAWVITRDDWRVLTLKTKREAVDRWSASLQRAAAAHDTDRFDGALVAAYDALLAKPMATIAKMPDGAQPRLVIVPDGAMYGIPFPALRNPSTRNYLIEQAPVETAGSAALYALSLKRDRELKRELSALLIGNPTNNLPGAKDEVTELANLYAPRATLRIGGDATIDEFINRSADNAIVHVAAHAVVDSHSPSHSSIRFSNGALDAAQLLARLKPGRTRLVVLAACSSAGGLPIGPEGVGPLVRPLIAKGIPAVVGSLWDVNDATAERLLVSFHQHYRKGRDAAAAMQLAQIELLRNPNTGLQSVLAWAPFQVIGHGSSPFPASR